MLSTPRLILKPFSSPDIEDLFTIRGDAETMRFWDWPADETIEQTALVAERFVAEMRAGVALYMTARLREGAFLGIFDLSELEEPLADLGFMVARPLWGRGYATEGARALVQEARRRGLDGLKARVHVGNEASVKLLTALGFKAVGSPSPVQITPERTVLCEHFRLDLTVR